MITIEAMSWTIRIGDDNNNFYDPYSAVCTATRAGVDTVRITGMVSRFSAPLTVKQSIMIAKALRDLGFDYAIWERLRDGKLVDVKVSLKRS